MRAPVPTESRLASLDVAKGVAILFVICIHSELFFPSILHTHVISRAVPMFLVLFGMTSTMWGQGRSGGPALAAWYRSRCGRLVPTYWLAVVGWWLGQRILSDRPLGIDALGFSLAGYAPWIQTSWFVTAILQLVAIFPAEEVERERVGLLMATGQASTPAAEATDAAGGAA